MPYDEGAFHFDVTSTYGSRSLLACRFHCFATIQSWWGWIFSDGKFWNPYTESEELKLLTKKVHCLLWKMTQLLKMYFT